MRTSTLCRKGQRGAVAVIVGVSLVVLVGFAGLVLDLGRLYINKTELQNAADACALAAAGELTCDPSAGACSVVTLQNAVNAGRFVASKNSRDFQNDLVAIAADDVRFSMTLAPNSAYQPAGSANPASKYAMCIAHSTGMIPWFMGVLGMANANIVNAGAVATMGPSQTFCSAAPIGICARNLAGPNFGWNPNEWVASNFNSAGSDDSVSGNMRWIDFTIQAGGNSEIREQLAGKSVCNLRLGQNVEQHGTQWGAKPAYNTRFGIYQNGGPDAYTPASAPPDRTGYAYPNKAPGSPVIPVNGNAYPDYVDRQAANTPFQENEYAGDKTKGNPSTPAEHAKGADRRTVAIPFIDCDAGQTVPILGMACALMLNPMSNGANGTIYLQYLGLANSSSEHPACRSTGLSGDSTSGGPLVPVLVQ